MARPLFRVSYSSASRRRPARHAFPAPCMRRLHAVTPEEAVGVVVAGCARPSPPGCRRRYACLAARRFCRRASLSLRAIPVAPSAESIEAQKCMVR